MEETQEEQAKSLLRYVDSIVTITASENVVYGKLKDIGPEFSTIEFNDAKIALYHKLVTYYLPPDSTSPVIIKVLPRRNKLLCRRYSETYKLNRNYNLWNNILKGGKK